MHCQQKGGGYNLRTRSSVQRPTTRAPKKSAKKSTPPDLVDGDSETMGSEAVAKEVMDGELVMEQPASNFTQTPADDFHPEDDTLEEPTNLDGTTSDSPPAGVHVDANLMHPPEDVEIPGDAAELEEADSDDDDMLSELSEGVDFQVCIGYASTRNSSF